ncbi:flagellar hook-length control protein FliK [Pararhizobium sp. DWP1-1-3]|uniref:flagellar hook-length control protein FliK n=1 Tax=Pararhizobium sp. DWP1-1-3 TaxID=2804652 RepID=UPI003CF4503E
MTFVDDNLLGASPVRSGKAGGKSGGKPDDMDAANQKSAFENAFADAGKKKQPVVSINGKPGVEGSLTQTLKSSAAEVLVAASKETGTDPLAVDSGENGLSPLQSLATDHDGLMKSLLGSSSTADTHVKGKMPVQGSLAAAKVDHLQKFSLMQASRAGAGEDAGETIDGLVGEKIAGLMKNAGTNLARHDDKTINPDDALAANAPDAAAGDVSQLLSLLDATQKPAAASQSVTAGTAPGMSEFQALAERAGKAKLGAKDTAKTEGQAGGDANAVKNATKAGTDAEADQVFRFARADGKGQAVSMSVASDGDKAVAKNEASAATARAETVTVVEARRYLGLAPSSNASAVTNQIASNPEWARALQPGSTGDHSQLTQVATGKVLNTLKIQMHPIDLGMVTATLRLKDDELHVEIKVETGDAFRQLSDDQSAMVKALRAQGFAVDQVNIVFNASDTSGSTAQQQPQPQTGQQGREAAGDGAKGQRNDNGGQGQGGERWTGNEGSGDASSGTELNRAGDVYM